MDALNAPTRRARRERHTAEMELGQPDKIVMPDEGLPERGEVIEPVGSPLESDYTRALLFSEEPVTILINKSAEKFAPLTVDCWVNGKGAEVMTDRGWVEFGWLPVERPVTTKRKYVEVLARSKHMSIQTQHGTQHDENPNNEVLRSNSLKAQFSVIGDKNPKGGIWLQQLMADRG